MSRLNQMAGLVPVILGLFCACQTLPSRWIWRLIEGDVCRPSFLHATIERPVFPDYQVNICDFGQKVMV